LVLMALVVLNLSPMANLVVMVASSILTASIVTWLEEKNTAF
jgi:hypothetical protein